MVKTYGQMPRQLFASPHQPHLSFPHIPANTTRSSRSSASSRCGLDLFRSVQGLRWGEFVGSPEYDSSSLLSPKHVIKLGASEERLDHLVAIQQRERLYSTSTSATDSLSPGCYGVPSGVELIANYKVDRRDPLRRETELLGTALVSWRSADNVLRVRPVTASHSANHTHHHNHHHSSTTSQSPGGGVWTNLLDLQSLRVSRIAFASSNDLLLVGFTCGLIRAYTLLWHRPDGTVGLLPPPSWSF